MSDLIIEAGQFYKTRIKTRAIVYATNQGGSKPVHGAIFNGTSWDIRAWDSRGHFAPELTLSHNIDLVSPWIDPPVVDWESLPAGFVAVAIDRNGNEYAYIDTCVGVNEKDGCFYVSGDSKLWAICPSVESYFELPKGTIQSTGDWRDSLVIRPGHEEKESQ